MKKMFLIASLFSSFFCAAQNYQCLQNGVKHYFTNANGYLRGIRIDSVKSFPDSVIYYPYHTPRGYYNPTTSSTLDSNGGSWLGKKVIQLNDGTFLSGNLWNDTIVIKTQAHVGDSWVFYRDTTTLYYEAVVIGTDTMTLLGAVDSIKTIQITAHNTTGIVTTDPANNFQMKLSKNNGFAQVFDLFTFPYHAPDSVYRQGLDYYLDYIIPKTGPIIPSSATSIFTLIQLVNPTYAQLYNWNVGDVYEYSSCNGLFEHTGAGCLPVEQYYLDTVTSVSIVSGNAGYNFNGLVYSFPSTTPVGSFHYSTSHNSGTISNSDLLLVIDTSLMPEEFHQSNIYYYIPGDTSYCITNTLYSRQENIEIVGMEYIAPFERYVGPTVYKYPLGLLRNSSASAGTTGSFVNSQNLIYYNNGSNSCSPIYIPPTLVGDITLTSNSIAIFPNPATDELNITVSGGKINSVAISDLIGQTMYSHDYTTEKVQVVIRNFPAGVYFVKINGVEVRKFVKE